MGGRPNETWTHYERGDAQHALTVDDIYLGVISRGDDARRIVACVNALAGIPDSSLEQDVVAKVREALEAGIELEMGDLVGPEFTAARRKWLREARAALSLLSDKEAE